jgi:hypothetical protein
MRKFPDSSEAFAAFIAGKTEIDTILACLTDSSAEHFKRTPDEITWRDVGALSSYLQSLREVNNAAFHEGELLARATTEPAGGHHVQRTER